MRCLATLVAAISVVASAQQSAPTQSNSDDYWPARITARLVDLAANAPKVLSSTPPAEDARTSTQPSRVKIRRAEAHGLGIVLELEPADAGDAARANAPLELVFVSYSPLEIARRGEVAAPPARLRFADIQRGVRWEFYEPKQKLERGLVVHLGGNKYVRRALVHDGWAVLSSSGTGRYFDRRRNPHVFQISNDADVLTVAERIAEVIDDQLADWPYSLEAVLDYLAEQRLVSNAAPAAIMGFSVGAIGLPAVVKRMPDRFAAAVIVAGGADLLAISQTSAKANPGIELRWTAPATADDLFGRLDDAYLARTKLDPYNAGSALSGASVLMVHAGFDQVVPARTGNTLWRKLGEPERRTFPVGHGHLLRVVMRMQAEQVAEWLAAVFEEGKPAAP